MTMRRIIRTATIVALGIIGLVVLAAGFVAMSAVAWTVGSFAYEIIGPEATRVIALAAVIVLSLAVIVPSVYAIGKFLADPFIDDKQQGRRA